MRLNDQDILQTIRTVASEFVTTNESEITPTTSLDDIDGWSSFAHINIMLLLEETLKISFQTDDISSADSIQDLIDIISKSA